MKIRIKRSLKEVSAVAGIQGGPGVVPFSSKEEIEDANKNEEEVSKLKGQKLEEMFSSSTQTGGVRISVVSAEKEHAGHVERSRHQGLRNVMEDTIELNNPDATAKLDRAIDTDTEPPERPTQAQLDYKELYKMVLERGYRLGSTLGSGQFGMVFSAEDLSSGGDYVIKVVGYGESQTPISQDVIDRELNQ